MRKNLDQEITRIFCVWIVEKKKSNNKFQYNHILFFSEQNVIQSNPIAQGCQLDDDFYLGFGPFVVDGAFVVGLPEIKQ